jgi:hypothetical protein
MHVAGGVYFERCLFPPWNQLYGSAGRAAALISQTGTPVTLHSYASTIGADSLQTVAATYGFQTSLRESPVTYAFDYVHPLAEPRIIPDSPSTLLPAITLREDVVLRFGMIEGDVVVRARVAVYDPQSAFSPVPFETNGSSAERLGVIMNAYEASRITGKTAADDALTDLLRTAEVAVIKNGGDGVLIGTAGTRRKISAFQANRAFTIGSGDVFSAAFAYFWAIDGKDPFDAAELASLAVAAYIESRTLPLLDDGLRIPTRSVIELDIGSKIYLAGPFFNLPQRWLVTEARSLLGALGMAVLSPLHDVGVGEAQDVAPRDIAMLKECDKVFAILDGSDEGTLFEVGYARAMQKPVICYTQTLTEEQLKMFSGTNCTILDDFASAIALTTQK